MGCGAAYLNWGYGTCVPRMTRRTSNALPRLRDPAMLVLMRMGREFVSGERLVPDDKAASRWLLSAAEQEVRSCSRGSRPSLNADD